MKELDKLGTAPGGGARLQVLHRRRSVRSVRGPRGRGADDRRASRDVLMSRAARQTSVLHATPGRLRVRLSPEAARRHDEVEQELRQVEGVAEVRASALTGNALIRFDPRQITAQ